MLLEQRKDFKVVFSLPFKFEGTKKWKFAWEVFIHNGEMTQVKYFDSENIRKEYGNYPIRAAYYKAYNQML